MFIERDLGSTLIPTTTSELFEFAPDVELMFPSKLAPCPSSWREVAP